MPETPEPVREGSPDSQTSVLPHINTAVSDALAEIPVPNMRDLQRDISDAVPALAQNGMEMRVVKLGGLTFCLAVKIDPAEALSVFNGYGGFRGDEMKAERDMIAGIRNAIPERVHPFIGLVTAPDETQVFTFLAESQNIPFRGDEPISNSRMPIRTTPEATITGTYSTIADILHEFPGVEIYINGTRTLDGGLVPSLSICVPLKNDSQNERGLRRRAEEIPDTDTMTAVKTFLTEKKCPYVAEIGFSREPAGIIMGRATDSATQRRWAEQNKPTFQQAELYYPL
ncbi:hypothetical protein KA050_02315 [Candidatus Gracilibacteria bacterium]|nr:hypothetical protein [Candidatus Gracilibacteria bacterium]